MSNISAPTPLNRRPGGDTAQVAGSRDRHDTTQDNTVSLKRILAWRPDVVTLLTVYGALFLVIPARNHVGSLGGAGRPTVILGLIAMLLWTASRLHPGLARHGRQPVRILLMLYLGTILAAYVAGHGRILDDLESGSSDRELLINFGLAGVALAAADGIPSRERLETLLARLVFFGAVMSLFGIVQYVFNVDFSRYIQIPGFSMEADRLGEGSIRGGNARVAGTAIHYVEFGVVAAMLVPIAVYRTFHAKTLGARQRACFALAIIVSAIPMAIARTAIIALVCALLVQAVACSWRHRTVLLVWGLTGTIAFAVVLPGLLGTLKSLFVNYESDPSYQARTADYLIAGDFISERPWFGLGPGTFMPEKYLFIDNQYLLTILSSGYVGLAGLIILLGGGLLFALLVAWQVRDQVTRELAQACASTISAAAVASFFFDSLSFPAFASCLFLILGVTGALWRLERNIDSASLGGEGGRVDRTVHGG